MAVRALSALVLVLVVALVLLATSKLQPIEVQVNIFTATAIFLATGRAIVELTGDPPAAAVPVGFGTGILEGEAMAARNGAGKALAYIIASRIVPANRVAIGEVPT